MAQGKRKDQEEFSSKMFVGAMGGIIGIILFSGGLSRSIRL
mgnify:CR=1 FL=1